MAIFELDNTMFDMKDDWDSQKVKERRRLKALSELNLRQSETIPVFEEATQTAAHFLSVPISILGFIDQEFHWFKSAIGLSRLGFMNPLAQTRQLLRQESFCNYVVQNTQVLKINDTSNHAEKNISESKLTKGYGIRSYLGIPLIDSAGNCLGTIAVMDLVPRRFNHQEIELLQVIARWGMSEFERNRLLKLTSAGPINQASWQIEEEIKTKPQIILSPSLVFEAPTSICNLKLKLLEQLTQELRTPLTSVLGMASVLGREIYGPLTTKQREYIEIIQHSGNYLLSLVNAINELGMMADNDAMKLNITPVDIEMLCQQAISTLEEVAHCREQDIRLSIEPESSRIYSLDRDKVRQILYHLISSIIQTSATGSLVRIHISCKENHLNITIWVSHPLPGEGVKDINSLFHLSSLLNLELSSLIPKLNHHSPESDNSSSKSILFQNDKKVAIGNNSIPEKEEVKSSFCSPHESLGLLLSSHLSQLHGGHISTHGSQKSGYQYILSLPKYQ
ncbi:GAF domain-containing sensor histidine kinase [Richelia intracellularis]|nr:GAF domain-containing sensor histidine kinase [Richelia intracellularis]